ncbi:hypothetical protein EDD34_2101 [Myceligenerans xiligouense]|uniref:ATP/GTP-binding protein n=2 Tax=Myceligenerans xiligouense TaxID=253184 RepID=A0A3N4Z827_9MICO|nr:hypothetical protein EDD34_2101 [Myceligenerans xiligouense]
MRRVVTRGLPAALALAGLLGLPLAATASTPTDPPGVEVGGDCQWHSPRSGLCNVHVSVPGGSGTDNVADGSDSGSNSTSTGSSSDASDDDRPPRQNDEGRPACVNDDVPIPCTSDDGYWRNDLGCYVSPTPMDPQPGGDRSGRDPFTGEDLGDEGAYYECFAPDGGGAGTVWLDEPPAQAPPPPTPGEVARQAVAQMNLAAIRIGIAPTPPATAVVGVPVWLWVADPDTTTFGPTTASATVRGVTVTATARVDQVRWGLGDGTTLSCGVGTPYVPEYGGAPSPDCGHIFTRESGSEPGGAYTVTATTTWVVEWAGAGQTGTITVDPLVAQTRIVVAEGQVLVS